MPGIGDRWRARTGRGPEEPAAESVPYPLDGETGRTERYRTRPIRPLAQPAVRIGLWVAVGFGCVAGTASLLWPSSEASDAGVVSEGDGEAIPAPVAGVAELAVERWLTAPNGDEALGELFVEPPVLHRDRQPSEVVGVTTVAAESLEDGYWEVTVAVDAVECVPRPDESGATGGADGDDAGEAEGRACTFPAGTEGAAQPGRRRTVTWYVEIGIVGEVDRGLAALTTPALMPGPPAVSDEWRPAVEDREPPRDDDPVASTVEEFLRAALAGDGDVARYLAPDAEVRAADPPPFIELDLVEIGVEELADGRLRSRPQVEVTTPGGGRQVLVYEVLLDQRADRWEIVKFWGAPTLAAAPSPG